MPAMKRVIFDIETAGKDFDTLDTSTQEYLLKGSQTEEDQEKVKDSLGLYPLTGEVISIGMLNPDTNKGAVYFQIPGDPLLPFEEDGIRFECGTEKEILEKFWAAVKTYDQFITFNGRAFDCPFIMVRSAVHRIKPSRDLMGNRYSGPHIDLMDQLNFYGASKRRFSLDMWCKTFGIQSPKAEGISGADVGGLFRAGRYIDIAKYCIRDIKATKELFLVWSSYIKA
ncbi:MAG: 3'-5' exonuclease [Nitrospirae bacterium]|nr:MAG: 3'-5' exonuclease [Nitrospirota bacterium]